MSYLEERRKLKLGVSPAKKTEVCAIPKQSEKRKKEQKEYVKIVKEMLLENKECSVKSPECTGGAQGLNHKQKRSPKNFLDRANLERSCNACNL
jgi:5-methylcytosine-specific restriction endonuclease McrA